MSYYSLEEREAAADELQVDIDNWEYEIDILEDMYKKAQELVELNKSVKMDMDYEDIRDEIDNEIVKRKEAIEENQEFIDDIWSGHTYADNCDALNREYMRGAL